MIQSILFPVNNWTQMEAEHWLIMHGFKTVYNGKHVHKTKHYYRYRQAKPIKGVKYSVKILPHSNGIRMIVQYPNEKR